jgi:hypothetical protein
LGKSAGGWFVSVAGSLGPTSSAKTKEGGAIQTITKNKPANPPSMQEKQRMILIKHAFFTSRI